MCTSRDMSESNKSRSVHYNLRLGEIVRPPKKHVLMKVRSSPYTVAIQEKTKQEQQNDFKKTEQHAVAGRARLHLH